MVSLTDFEGKNFNFESSGSQDPDQVIFNDIGVRTDYFLTAFHVLNKTNEPTAEIPSSENPIP